MTAFVVARPRDQADLPLAAALDEGAVSFSTVWGDCCGTKVSGETSGLGTDAGSAPGSGHYKLGDERYSLLVAATGRAATEVEGPSSDGALAPSSEVGGVGSKVNAHPTIIVHLGSSDNNVRGSCPRGLTGNPVSRHVSEGLMFRILACRNQADTSGDRDIAPL